MQKKIFFIVVIMAIAFSAFSQQLPLGTCGIINIYDAAGNRTKRVYYCNNGGEYPSKTKTAGETKEFQAIDALYPNPTTGKFFIEFSKALNNARIYITDGNGKMISQFKAAGNKIDFDLSSVAAGVYFVRIEDGKNIIIKKVVKQ
jgi:hypothetical protein